MDAGPGLGRLVRNVDILNRVQLPRMDGIEQMLVTYPDVLSGGWGQLGIPGRGEGAEVAGGSAAGRAADQRVEGL